MNEKYILKIKKEKNDHKNMNMKEVRLYGNQGYFRAAVRWINK